jgi:amino acid transporter
VKESGKAFATPTYLFMAAILGMAAWGFWRHYLGELPPAPTADYTIVAHDELSSGITGLAGAFLLLRAFSSGCAALTGVEAISNGVPAFRKPKGRNAATTLLLLGAIAITMGMSIIALANITDVRMVHDPATELRDPSGQLVGANFHQVPVIGQLAQAVFSNFEVGFYFVTAATGVILVLASNTAFNGFPVLGSILARDGYMPRQLHTRGDRLAYSNGIFVLAGFAIALIYVFDAQVTALIPLYTVGVFVAFTCSQTGMVRHWTRLLKTEADPGARRRMQRSRLINGIGLMVTGVVLVVVLVTKFLLGAWIAIAAMVAIYFLMRGIRRHYQSVGEEIAVADEDVTLPARVHAIVLVSKLHKPTMRAVAYARAARPSLLEAVTVDVDADSTAALMDEWDRHSIPIPLKVLDSPYREVTRPILGYVRSIRRDSPRDVVAVYVPEYVVGHWWEQLLHNQSALRLKTRLRLHPGVMVISVPYQLHSSARMDAGERPVAAGDTRRGRPE